MAKDGSYVIEQRALNELVQSYLDNLGLANKAVVIIEDFTRARILENRPEERVCFRYRAFLEYFIANQMQIDSEFREWMLSEERYLSFTNEIQYYAGINRADNSLLELVSERFKAIRSAAVADLGWEPDLTVLEKFQLPSEGLDAEHMLREYEEQVGASPLTAEERDAVLEADLPRDVENRQEVFRPQVKEVGHRLIVGLMLYSGLVRNLELIAKPSKQHHLNSVLDAWGLFLMGSFQIIPQLAKHRKLKVNGVTYEIMMPKHFTESQVARTIYLAMPAGLAHLIWGSLGTEKLELQLKDTKVEHSGIVNFFRGSLSADLKLGNWWHIFADFAERYRESPYLLQVLLWKMRDLHVMNEVPKEGVANFRKTIADIVATVRGGDQKQRIQTRSSQIQKLNKDDLRRRILSTKAD